MPDRLDKVRLDQVVLQALSDRGIISHSVALVFSQGWVSNDVVVQIIVLHRVLKLFISDIGPLDDLGSKPAVIPVDNFMHQFGGEFGVIGRSFTDLWVLVLQSNSQVIGLDMVRLQGEPALNRVVYTKQMF
jgi:hypothetical protein